MVAMITAALHRAGLEALQQDLGVAGMVRFLQQIDPGSGDYTAERRQWLPEDEDVETLLKRAEQAVLV